MKSLVHKLRLDRLDLGALLITTLYLLAGGLWIPSSDYLASWIAQGSHERLTQISIYKGWGYVLVTGLLLYLLIHINNRSLHRINRNYLLLAENISDVVWILDIEAGRFTYVSPSIKSLRGLTPEEAVRESPQQALLPESWEHINSVLPARIAEFQKGMDKTYTDELAQPRRDGSTVWVETTSRFVVNEQSGRLEAYAISRDMTERRQAREELKRSETRFRSAFDTMLEGCQIIGFDWRYLYLNAAAERHNRRPNHELLGQRYQEMWPGIEGAPVFATLQRCMLERATARLETRFIYPDGQEGWFDLSIQPVPEGLFILSLDTSERVRAERQAARMTRLYAILSQVNQAIVRVRGHDELFHAICDVSVQFGGFALAWVGLLDESSGEVRPAAASGLDAANWPFPIVNLRQGDFQNGLIAAAIRSGRVLTSEDIQADERAQSLRQGDGPHEYHSSAAVPFRLKGTVLGVLNLVSRETGLFNDTEETRLLEEMGLDISFALDTLENEKVTRQWADAFENCAHGIAIGLPAFNRILTCNPAFARQQGRTVEEVASMSILEQYDPRDHEHVRASIAEADRTGHTQYEARMVRKNGSVYPVQMDVVSVRDEAGRLLYRVATQQDITARKRAVEILRESEARFSSVFHTSPIGIHIFRLSDGRSLDANQAFLELTGYTRQELLGRTALELNLFADPAARTAWMEELRRFGSVQNQDARIRHKNGSLRDALASLEMIEIGGEAAVLVIAADITERKQAEEALRRSEAQYRYLFENNPHPMWAYDLRTLEFLAVNDSAVEKYGYSREEFLSMTIADIRPRNKVERLKQDISRPRPSLQHSGEWRHKLKNGEIIDVEISSHTLQLENREAALVVAQDITERKQAEHKVKTQLKRISALNEIDRAIGSSLDMRLSLEVLLSEVLSQLGVDATCVLLLDPHSQSLEFVAGKGFHGAAIRHSRMRLGEGLAGQVGLERKVLHLPDLAAANESFKRSALLKDERFVEYFGVPLTAKGTLKGVLEIFHRSRLETDHDWLNYLETLGGQAAIAIDNAQLFEGVQRSNLELVTAYDATIAGWSRAMDLRDKETEGHTQRVTDLTLRLAERMGFTQQELVHIRRGALLHDIGKLGVPDHILLKAGPLTPEEWEIMRQHPAYAFDMLLPIAYLRPALDIPYSHHEKWDGSGYPRGLKGEQIPLAARIFAVVDVWDALRSDRPYRASWSAERTRAHILEQSGSHFDPQVVAEFVSLLQSQEGKD